MHRRSCFALRMKALFLVISFLASTKSVIADDDIPSDFNKTYFRPGFYFGSSTSAYQVEGQADTEGRKPSVWDTFAHEFPERIADGSNGDTAVNFYERYPEDLANMKLMGLNAFRFSISWSRVIPTGRISDGVNEEGIDFYNRLINETKELGMEPFVTIFHWDTPQALEEDYGGFLSPSIIDDYKDYANLCFERFGDRVKYWITFNEPWAYSAWGHSRGIHAPGRCSSWVNQACIAGDSASEPYIVGHHIILAHAASVESYRQNKNNTGKIGMTLISFWYEPYDEDSYADHQAASVALDFMFGWFMDPLTYGEYPNSMLERVGDRLPKFNFDQIEMIKGSYDFLGLNYYTAYYASANFTPDPNPNHLCYETDSQVNVTQYKNGVPIGDPTALEWLKVYPQGIRYLLNYTKNKYGNLTIYITENGIGEYTDTSVDPLKDLSRIEYYQKHLWNIFGAINDSKVAVEGYFAWSFLDNFEWAEGYTIRFGLYYVNYSTLDRIPKDSVGWFTGFLNPDTNKISKGSFGAWNIFKTRYSSRKVLI